MAASTPWVHEERQHDREQLAVEPVDLLVVPGDVGGEADVLGGDDGAGLGDDGLGEAAHLGEGPAQLLGDGQPGVAQAGLLGDVLGEVAHALERRGDAQGADGHPQVGRRRAARWR